MKKTSSTFKPIRMDSRQVGLMLRVASFFKPSICKELGADSPDEVELCADLIGRGVCAPSVAVLRYLNLRAAGEGCYVWNAR